MDSYVQKCASIQDNARHSVGATIFNAILIFLGIRVPYQNCMMFRIVLQQNLQVLFIILLGYTLLGS